jgi:hypothetical protein
MVLSILNNRSDESRFRVISDEGMEALRVAATLAHCVPAVRVKLRNGERVVIDVAAPGAPVPLDVAQAVTPCGFRAAVARAWGHHRAGCPQALLDIDADPAIDLGLPAGGARFGAGIVSVALPGRQLYVAATTLPLEVCEGEAAAHTAGLAPPAGMWGIGIRHDDATDVCLVYAELDTAALPGGEAMVLDLLEGLVARFAVRQLIDSLPNSSPSR